MGVSRSFGQVLIKKSKTSPWSVFEQTQSFRVQALDSFPIPSDQGLGPGHALLVTQAIVAGRSRIQWLLDGANSFFLRNSYVLPAGADVRAFGAHESGGTGPSTPESARRGSFKASGRQLAALWFSIPFPSSRWPRQGRRGGDVKVTGFADCGGAIFTTNNTTLYRRNDGAPCPLISLAGSRSTERSR